MKTEKDYYFFEYRGLPCVINRVIWSGHLCGYVGIPKNHALYGKKYSEYIAVNNLDDVKFNGNYIGLLINSFDKDRAENEASIDMLFDVHGGITYSENSAPNTDKEQYPDTWWFGFDCAHSGDLCPKNDFGGGVYRDAGYVKKEIHSLVDQLLKFSNHENN